MNVDSETSGIKKKEGFYRGKRPNYYQNTQRRGSFNRHKHQNHENARIYSSNNFEGDEVANNNLESFGASNEVGHKFSALNVRKFNTHQGANNHHNYGRQTEYRSYTRDYNQNSNHGTFKDDRELTEYPPPPYSVPKSPERGQIVGGRYIRKHSNPSHVTNSKIHRGFQLSNGEIERNQKRGQRVYSSSYNSGSSSSYYEDTSQRHSKRDETLDRDTDDYSSESSASYNNSYHSRDNYKKYNDPYSSKYQSQNYNSFSRETTSYKRSNFKQRSSPQKSKNDEDKATQRELLICHLNKGECECLVCCELIRTKDQTWHCLSCYHVFHLRCIKKWARSPAAAKEDGSWRCPACQSLNNDVPFNYFCFCGKSKNPEVNYHLTPHSCGEICDRVRSDCSHPCKELCHPGPCPPCGVVVQKSCPCGKTNQKLPCNRSMESSCQYVCDKVLNCGVHQCQCLCHEGQCPPCKEVVTQKCYCEKSEQSVTCTKETAFCFDYSCGNMCNKDLSCGHHTCTSVCHPGACKSCQMSVEAVKYCCCGQSSLEVLVAVGKIKLRTSCQDPIPVCGLICKKKLLCGPKETPHSCQSFCHEGDCPVCPLTTSVKCSCGAFTKEFPCVKIMESFVYKCEKRCNRRKDCSRHKCLNNCCTNIEHRCELVCNKKLSCGLHQCQEICHIGNCPTCWNVSFDELRCHCGASVSYPPIACGTKPPECSEPCTRRHFCEHDVKHTCHSDEKCPPCTSLTTKWCYGKHKQCGPVMCFLDGVSCGMPCQKPLPCGRHTCKSTCHAGSCLKDSEKCTQPCTVPRDSCGHPCNNPCHDGDCADTPCKAQVTSSCPCGHRSETATCYESSKSYRLMSSTILATKMQEIKDGQSVNLSDVLGRKSKNNKLQCNEECAVIERNKRLAVALQIQNPDLSCSPGPPNYSEFLKDEARKYPQFVSDVYEKLTSLVQLAKQSKQKCRSHSFAPMNRDQRRIVHELAEFFGCETQSYDEEPKKNVVATAYKNKCWLPFTNIMAIVQRDKGIRKGPAPVLVRDPKSITGSNGSSATSQKKKIDYFDYNES